MSNLVYVDLDDFCEENHDWHKLVVLKELVPALKLNLFTIPGLCSYSFVKEMRKIEWIRLYPHGCLHTTSRECQHWSYQQSVDWLEALEDTQWIKVWKSPGWQTSDALFQVLAERNWIVADQAYNNQRRPSALRTYFLDSPDKLHGHIGHMGSHNANALEYIFEQLAALTEREFGFIDELWTQ